MLRELSTVLLATMLVLTAFAPAAAAQETTGSTIDLTLTQDPATGDATLTVTNGTDGVADATAEVSSTVAYAGNGTYTTDANGTVTLPEPEQTTEVTAVVTSADLETIETSTVEPIAEFVVEVTAADDGSATVSVVRDGEAVDNATVTVESDVAYAGNGTYTTDANGTVTLPEPGQETTVTVTAEDGDDTATTDAQLSPVDTGLAVDVTQQSDGTAIVAVSDDGTAVENASVNVTAEVAYEGTGTYESGAEGTVELPNPEQNLTASVTATNGSENVTTTAELDSIENGGYANFGQWISSYVQQLQTSGYFGPGLGQKVSEFATENNPGAEKRPDHAGPPDDAGATVDDETNATDEDEDEDTRGPPDHAKQGNDSEDVAAEGAEEDDERGPPEHAKGKDKDDEQDDTEEEAETDEETDADAEDTDSDSDCDVESSDDSCEDEENETEEEEEDEEEDDDSPGNSGDKGNRGNGGGNGNGRGK
jgi:hypothetical protein